MNDFPSVKAEVVCSLPQRWFMRPCAPSYCMSSTEDLYFNGIIEVSNSLCTEGHFLCGFPPSFLPDSLREGARGVDILIVPS